MDRHILLIYPPSVKKYNNPDVPPLGLAYLASFIREHAHEQCKIEIWDLNLEGITEEQFRLRLSALNYKPDVIGIGGIVTVFVNLLWMFKVCKDIFPHALLIAGGSVASTVPHLLFTHSPVDVCVKGEGELTLLEIVNKYFESNNKCDFSDVLGIFLWDKEKGELISTPERPQNYNLDTFGMPAYDLLDVLRYADNGIINLKRYKKDLPPIFSSKNRHMDIITSRGCTNKCSFCFRQFPKIGINSPEFIKKHIIWLYKNYGINIFNFIDELFNISRKRLDEMSSCLEEIKQEIPDFYFRIAAARVDVLNDDDLKRLKKAGCLQITYGLESGSKKILELINKRATVEQNRNAVLGAKKAGIFCCPQFVVGLPGEDRSTLRETIKFIKSTDFWSALAIHNANAYPGSQIYNYAQEKGLINDEFNYVSSLSDTEDYPLALADISKEEMWSMLRRFLIWREVRLIFKKYPSPVAFFVLGAWLTRKIKKDLILNNKWKLLMN